jgi:hypothetical protein
MWAGMSPCKVTRTTEPNRLCRTLCSMLSSRSSASNSWIPYRVRVTRKGCARNDSCREERVQVGSDHLIRQTKCGDEDGTICGTPEERLIGTGAAGIRNLNAGKQLFPTRRAPPPPGSGSGWRYAGDARSKAAV